MITSQKINTAPPFENYLKFNIEYNLDRDKWQIYHATRNTSCYCGLTKTAAQLEKANQSKEYTFISQA